MARKKIDGSMASSLMDAVEHMARLELEMKALRWRACYHDDTISALAIVSQKARAHCRKMMQALGMVEHRLLYGESDDQINAEQERAVRVVK